MPVRLTNCYITQIKHKAYNKKDPNSTTGQEENRVKITIEKDCKRVSVQQEEADEENALDKEEEEIGTEEEKTEPTMKTLMENFRRFTENKEPENMSQ